MASSFGYRPWTQQDLSLLYNLRVTHPNSTWDQITEMYQSQDLAGRSRTSDALPAKWSTLNRQQAAPLHEADTAVVAITLLRSHEWHVILRRRYASP